MRVDGLERMTSWTASFIPLFRKHRVLHENSNPTKPETTRQISVGSKVTVVILNNKA